MRTIRKDELIERVARRTHIPKTTIRHALDAVLEEIALALAQKDRGNIARFGTFDLRHYPERTGVHPRTGEPMTYPKRYAPSFRSSLTLKRRVREGE